MKLPWYLQSNLIAWRRVYGYDPYNSAVGVAMVFFKSTWKRRCTLSHITPNWKLL